MQIEEKKRKQREEDNLKRKQDELDEERIRKEMEQEEKRFKMEKDMEQRKIEEAKRMNQQIIESKRKPPEVPPLKLDFPREPTPEGPPQPNYSNYERASKDYSQGKFAPGQAPPEYQPPGPENQK